MLSGGAYDDAGTADYTAAASAITVDQNGGYVLRSGGSAFYHVRSGGFGGTLHYIENVIGGDGDDAITGNQVANLLESRAGSDRLIGGGGNTLLGGPGRDILEGGRGAVHLRLLQRRAAATSTRSPISPRGARRSRLPPACSRR